MTFHAALPHQSEGLVLHLPLVHQGSYCCVHQIPAFVAPHIQFSTNRITKVCPVNATAQIHSSFKDMLAFLSNQRLFSPAAYDHKHISPFFIEDVEENTSTGLEPGIALVRRWYHEDILQFGSNNPGVAKIPLLIQAAQAIEHLHDYDIVHGHIHPGNIFITDRGYATLVDVSVYTQARRFILHPAGRIPPQLSSIYQAPEFLYPGTDAFIQPAKASDVYAFASVILAVLTGNPPFYGSPVIRSMECATAEIIRNGHQRIRKPDSIGDTLWTLLQYCWHQDPNARPRIGDVVTALEDIEIYGYS
ncbi:kinase-like domain-containing protein [Lyophyllum atratum]|nr:kinase-like domain-containing protein [Lyophyllum atratum]